MRGQVGDQVQPGRQQLGAVPGQVPVPHVQRADVPAAAGPPRRAGRLQQGTALLEHPVVVGAHPGEPRRAQHQQLVHEPPPLPRVAPDQGQVLGGEQHGAQDAQHVTRPRHRAPVDPGPVGPARGDLQLDQQLAPLVDHGGAHHGPLGAVPHQGSVRGHPVRTEGGHVPDRLNQVGLALTVRADQHARARLERHVRVRPRAEVADLEMPDEHRVPRVSRPGWSRPRNSARPGARRVRRTGCAARRPRAWPASPPGGRRTGRTAPPRSPAPAPRG